MKRRLRFGMIGGGRGAFIGAVHRIAAQLDGKARLVAGALSSDPARARLSGRDLGLEPGRIYGDYLTMARLEARQPPATRLDFVVIVTPNDQHYPVARCFLEAGFNVICDKPVTRTLAEARTLSDLARRRRKVFVLTHNYPGNAMVKQARHLVRAGVLGALRKVVVEYQQGWLSTPLEATGHKQAAWATDPRRSGSAGCVANIGTHAENLARYVTGLRIKSLCAELTTFVAGRSLDDDNCILVRYHGGAKGILNVSQVCIGEENNLSLRIYGTKAALEWHQEEPNELILKYPDRPRETWRQGNSYLAGLTRRFSRLPPGHPEGFLEAFGNIYAAAFPVILAEVTGRSPPKAVEFATIADGVEGMAFVETALRSSRAGGRWTAMPER